MTVQQAIPARNFSMLSGDLNDNNKKSEIYSSNPKYSDASVIKKIQPVVENVTKRSTVLDQEATGVLDRYNNIKSRPNNIYFIQSDLDAPMPDVYFFSCPTASRYAKKVPFDTSTKIVGNDVPDKTQQTFKLNGVKPIIKTSVKGGY